MIPYHIHFIYLRGDKPFSLIHLLAIESARVLNPGSTVTVHFDVEPRTPAWKSLSSAVAREIVEVPSDIHGIPLGHVAHKVDAIRLQLANDIGGIYLDADVLTVASFKGLLGNDFVLGWQDAAHQKGLGCATILAAPHSDFGRLWYQGYDPAHSHWSGFRSRGYDEHWAEMSTRYPAYLSESGLAPITTLEHTAFYPFGFEDDELFRLFRGPDGSLYPETVSLHLWEMRSWERYLRNFDLSTQLSHPSPVTTAISRLARDYGEGLGLSVDS